MSDEGYPIPAMTHRTEQTIDRSRFVATLAHASTVDAARTFVDEVRAEFPDATHNCWAFLAGPPGSTSHVGFSDAGEPHGTAGRPMLDVLLHSGLGEVAAVVTRWYGGVKLGKGGLVRAYGGAVQHNLESLPTKLLVERVTLDLHVGYAEVEPLRRLLAVAGAEVLAEQYGADVHYRAAVPLAAEPAFRQSLADVTAGRARIDEADGA